MQWNDPYEHLMAELRAFAIFLAAKHVSAFQREIANTLKQNAYCKSHKVHRMKHAKKYKMPVRRMYKGSGGGVCGKDDV